MQRDLPLKVTIPTPSDIPRARGIYATTSFGDNLKVRCSGVEIELIDKASAIVGSKRANFIRWCAVHVAQMLVEWNDGRLDAEDDTLARNEPNGTDVDPAS